MNWNVDALQNARLDTEAVAETGTFAHEGRDYTADGTSYDGQKLIAYLDRVDTRLVLANWKGTKIIADPVYVFNQVRRPNGVISDETLYIRTRFEGAVFSGQCAGVMMAAVLRRTKRRSIF